MLFFGLCYIYQFLKFAFCCEFLLHSKKYSFFTQSSVYNFTGFLQEVPPKSLKGKDILGQDSSTREIPVLQFWACDLHGEG